MEALTVCAGCQIRKRSFPSPETNKNISDPANSHGGSEYVGAAEEESTRRLNNKKLGVICNCQRLESFGIGMETNRREGEV